MVAIRRTNRRVRAGSSIAYVTRSTIFLTLLREFRRVCSEGGARPGEGVEDIDDGK